MKILHIIDHMGFGGAQQLLRDMLPELEKSIDGEMHLCVLREHIYERLPDISRVFCVHSRLLDPFVIFRVLDYIRSNGIEILHLHLQKSIFVGLIISAFIKIKAIIHVHTDILEAPFYYRILLKLFRNEKSIYIGNSVLKADHIKRVLRIKSGRVVGIQNFVNLAKFNPYRYDNCKLRKKYDFSGSDFIIGFFGRLTAQKRPDYVIQIARILSQKIHNIKFIIVGDGPFLKRLKKEVDQKGLKEVVYFLGYRDDVPELMSMIDLGISTSAFGGNAIIYP